MVVSPLWLGPGFCLNSILTLPFPVGGMQPHYNHGIVEVARCSSGATIPLTLHLNNSTISKDCTFTLIRHQRLAPLYAVLLNEVYLLTLVAILLTK